MKQDEKRIMRVLYVIGIIPIIWIALLLAPYTKGGLIEIIKNGSVALNQPFKIVIVENSIRTILIFLIIYIFSILLYESTRKNYRRREENGSAKWGEAKELNKKYKQPNNYCKPNVMQCATSYVILDPKGEIVRDTGYLLEKERI